MDTRRVAVSSIDIAVDLEHATRVSTFLGGWTVFATQVEQHQNRVPTLLRLFCCAPPKAELMEGMVALAGFAVHDYVEPGEPSTKMLHGVEVDNTPSRALQWRKSLRSFYGSGFRGLGRRSVPFLPSQPQGDWWVFWAPISQDHNASD